MVEARVEARVVVEDAEVKVAERVAVGTAVAKELAACSMSCHSSRTVQGGTHAAHFPS